MNVHDTRCHSPPPKEISNGGKASAVSILNLLCQALDQTHDCLRTGEFSDDRTKAIAILLAQAIDAVKN